MAFQLSPGVLVVEKDLTSIIPAVATSTGAFAGAFVWGPVLDITQITSENQLVSRFGRPQDGNAASWLSAANFLSYTNNLQVVRVASEGQLNAVAAPAGSVTGINISNAGANYATATATFSDPTDPDGQTAVGTVVLNANGGIESIQLTGGNNTPGYGYSGNASVTIEGTARTGEEVTLVEAVLTPVIVNGSLSSITIVNGGLNYNSTAEIQIEGNAIVVPEFDQYGTITGFDIQDPGTGYSGTPAIAVVAAPEDTLVVATATIKAAVITTTVTTAGVAINNEADYLTTYVNGGGYYGQWAAKYPGALGNSLRVEMVDASTYSWTTTQNNVTTTNYWNHAGEFDAAPGTSSTVNDAGGSNDEVHIIVIDEDGLWTGTRGTIIEKFAFASKAFDAKKSDGTNNYYKEVINTNSKYIWWMDHPSQLEAGAAWGSPAANSAFASLGDGHSDAVSAVSLAGGADDLNPADLKIQDGYDLFANAELVDISLVVTGAVKPNTARYIVNNIADVRRDCVAFVSPSTAEGAVIQGADANEKTIDCRKGTGQAGSQNLNLNTSYAVMDSGWKYQYDRYNDVYRWVPLNGDIAGLCARTDYTNDAWWSPGGLNRGQIKGVVKLSLNPNQAQRDELYKAGVNPVVSFPGQGTVLFGDKTMLNKPSAFDRINVRRLFIVLEKAIATASKYQLFEFNDGFTRAQFRSMVEPFLRDVQGRRGIIDFRVKCDETNNTGEVIDRNEFVADIFIKPARSINFITLNFIAARTAVSFDEIGA